MFETKNKFVKLILAAVSLCFVFSLTAYGAAETAQDKLEKGKQLYSEGKYNQAMDNFVDVFVQGNNEQISEANEYVNMIHMAMGSVEAPKQVPYNPALEKNDDGHVGKVLSGAKNNPYEDEIVPQDNMAAKPARTAKQPVDSADYTAASAAPVTEQIISEDSASPEDSQELKESKKQKIDTFVASETQKIIARLSKVKGVNVYKRDNLVDAIDIDSEVIFQDDKITYTPQAKAVLDDVYALMILNGTPSFVLLPPGAYTDDVSIQGVRQVVALNSYFINMGISGAKLNFNMGLASEQPPAKFSDLEGISIVFDYTTKPNLRFKLSDTNLPPVLSIGLYPAEAFTPQNDEGMMVDFSVVETSNPVADWKLQIVQHAGNGKYYVVRQVSGTGAAYQQLYWNGRKQFFGQYLPLGRYTIILIAQDSTGKQKVVRRKVTLLGKDEVLPAAKAAVAEDGKLNYTAARLWTKPQRTAGPGASEVPAAAEQPAEAAPTADPYGGAYNGVNTFSTGNTAAGNGDGTAASAAPAAQPAANPYDVSDPLSSGSADYSAPAAAAAPAPAPAPAPAAAPKGGANVQYPAQQPQENNLSGDIVQY